MQSVQAALPRGPATVALSLPTNSESSRPEVCAAAAQRRSRRERRGPPSSPRKHPIRLGGQGTERWCGDRGEEEHDGSRDSDGGRGKLRRRREREAYAADRFSPGHEERGDRAAERHRHLPDAKRERAAIRGYARNRAQRRRPERRPSRLPRPGAPRTKAASSAQLPRSRDQELRALFRRTSPAARQRGRGQWPPRRARVPRRRGWP